MSSSGPWRSVWPTNEAFYGNCRRPAETGWLTIMRVRHKWYWLIVGGCLLASRVYLPAAEWVTVRPREIDTPLHNPMKGWVLIDHAVPGEIDAGQSLPRVADGSAYEWFQDVAVLSTWALVEPQPDRFDWALMDRAMAFWAAQGKRLHLRFSTDQFGRFPGCPEWLYAQGVPRQFQPDGRSFPDYSHPVYRKRLRNFLRVFAARFCSDPRIETIDLRAYGDWGEWHSGYGYPNLPQRRKALAILLAAWRDANQGRKWLNLSASYEWMTSANSQREFAPQGLSIYEWPPPSYAAYRQGSLFDEAFQFPDVTLRRDGVGGAVKQEYDGRLIANFFAQQRKPVTMECFGGLDAYVNGRPPIGFPDTKPGDDFVQNALDEIVSHHANYATPIGWLAQIGATEFYNRYRPAMLETHKLMGYRFVLVRATYPRAAAPGDPLLLFQTWENRAHGRCYRRCPLRVSLTQNGRAVWAVEDARFDQRNWMAGETYDIASRFSLPGDLPEGEYDLHLRMALTESTDNLRLAVAGAETDGVLSLGRITIARGVVNATDASNSPIELTRKGDGWFGQTSLRADEALLVSFEYEVTRNPKLDLHSDTPGFFRFCGLDTNGRRHQETRWFDAAGQPPATKTCLLFGATNRVLQPVWESVGGGALRIRQVSAQRLPVGTVRRLPIRPDARESSLLGSAGFQETDRVVVERERSQVRLPHDWHDFLKTQSAAFPLAPNATYTVFFDCAMRPQVGQGDFAYLSVRRAGETAMPSGTMFRWTQRHTADPVRRVYSFRIGPTADNELVWGIKNGGRCVIANVVVVER